ncbi:MAG: hypothetical protein YK1309IOTA_1970008, partial [Marine Group I thaumarchaeote]
MFNVENFVLPIIMKIPVNTMKLQSVFVTIPILFGIITIPYPMNDECTKYKSYTISRTLKNQDLSRSRQGINLAIQGTILVKPVDEIKIFL